MTEGDRSARPMLNAVRAPMGHRARHPFDPFDLYGRSVETNDASDAAHGGLRCIDLDELVRDQPIEQLFEIASELLAVHVIFRAQRLVRRLDRRPRAQELPGPRPNLIEPEVGLGVEARTTSREQVARKLRPTQNVGAPGFGFEIVDEVATWPKGYVPAWPFGTEHKEFADTLGVPYESTQGYKEAAYPEYLPKLRKLMAEMPAAPASAKPAATK
jgi:hypothetical protein